MFPYEDSKTLSVCPYPEKRYHHSFVNISPTLVIDASIEWSSRVLQHGNPEMWNFFQKVRNWRNWILSVHRVSVCREKKSPWLREYQSYISNWHVNGKVFTSTTAWEPKNLIFFFFSKKFEIEFDLYFDLCWRAYIIQVGLNMHLYVDIGDASSSLWRSTSSYFSEKYDFRALVDLDKFQPWYLRSEIWSSKTSSFMHGFSWSLL